MSSNNIEAICFVVGFFGIILFALLLSAVIKIKDSENVERTKKQIEKLDGYIIAFASLMTVFAFVFLVGFFLFAFPRLYDWFDGRGQEQEQNQEQN